MQPTQVNHLTHTTDVAASTTSRVNVARSRSALGTPFVPSGGKCLKSVVMLRAIRLADHHPEPASRAHAAANDTSKFSRNDTRRWWTGYHEALTMRRRWRHDHGPVHALLRTPNRRLARGSALETATRSRAASAVSGAARKLNS